MPVALEMILLLFLFGSVWAQNTSSESPNGTITLQELEPTGSSASLVSNIYETTKFNSMTSNFATTEVPKTDNSTEHKIFPPSSTPYTANEVSSPGTSIAASRGPPVNESIISQKDSAKTLSMPLEISNATSIPAVPVVKSAGFHTTTGETVATSPLETSSGTSGPPVTTATSSLETSDGISGPPITTAISSLKTSNVTSGPPVIMETSSLKTSKETSGLPVTMATTSLKTPLGTSGSPTFGVKISSPTSSTSSRSSPNSGWETNGTLLVAVLVALLVLIFLMALLLLWRQRQKRKTGVVTFNRGGKHNGVANAWAGVAQVSHEEAATITEGVSGGNNDSGAPQGEGSGQRPTLTTFFGRRKSRQGSVALEELKPGPSPSLKGEEEPLVGSKDEAVETSTSDGPEERDVEAP
ncbi:leukosialin [Neophocaena asiaeorientalis asiaeorientalis]|uniref:Leukosialin n=1 Tax=Neophocaena asiaeorientalis asiaeorientalis TaxID=1706337 RepID=A0A341BDI4_NEOAA|nr:leukosialin [Neophocaena asiaeorientalis asiaeorientalis]